MTRIALAFFLAGGRPVVLGVDGQRVEEAHVLVNLGQTAGIRVDVVVPDSKAGAQDPRIAGRQHRVAELVGIERVVNVLRIQVVAVCATVAAAVGHHVVGVVQDVDEREALIEHALGVGPTKGPDVHLDALTALGLGTAAGKPATIEAAPNTRRVTAVQQVRHEVVVELAIGRTAVGDDELIGAHMHDGVRVEHGVRARGVVVEDIADELASLGLADIEVIDGRTVLTSGRRRHLGVLDGELGPHAREGHGVGRHVDLGHDVHSQIALGLDEVAQGGLGDAVVLRRGRHAVVGQAGLQAERAVGAPLVGLVVPVALQEDQVIREVQL